MSLLIRITAGFNAAYNAWHNIALQVVEKKVTAFLDGVQLTTYTDPNPRLSGRVDLASGYYYTCFDNLKVETVDGYAPYYSELLDNLEMNDLASIPATKLVYEGLWVHENGKGMYNYQRSLSTSQGTGSTLRYTFTGTGLDILGPNNGSAQLEVTVDGKVVNASAGTMASKEFYQTFTLRGLTYGVHTVQFRVLSGALVVDAVAVVSTVTQGTNILMGDLNGDNAVNSVDLSYLQRYLLGLTDSFPSANGSLAADLNGDQVINSTDYALFKRFLLGLIDKFPYQARQLF